MWLMSGMALVVFQSTKTSAFAMGTGSCNAGTDAILVPGLSHATNMQVGTGPLGDSGFNVTLDGELLFPDTPTDFMAGSTYSLEILANDAPFRGFLARIEGDGSDMFLDTTTALASNGTDTGVQVALATCVNVNGVGGVTHTDNDEKTSAKAILVMDDPAAGLLLDVTVVVRNVNSENVSEWYFSRYVLNAVGLPASPAPTSSPILDNSTNAPAPSEGTQMPTSAAFFKSLSIAVGVGVTTSLMVVLIVI